MKIKYIVVASVLLISTSFLCLQSTIASAKKPAELSSFEGTKAWGKLDLRFKEAWRDAVSKGERSKKFECMLKTSRNLSNNDKNILKAAGFLPRTFIGTIITGSVAVSNVPAVADLDFVLVLELASPLTPKHK